MSSLSERLIIVNRAKANCALATSLSRNLTVAVVDADNDKLIEEDWPYQLVLAADQCYLLRQSGRRRERISFDFTTQNFLKRLLTTGKRQPLGKSIGLHKKTAIKTVYDLTAGLGRDALTLAYLGCQVHLVEQSPLVAHLLFNALHRARPHPLLGPLITHQLSWQQDQAATVLSALTAPHYPDVIYLDPMFPHKKKTAKVKILMQMLQDLVGTEAQEPLLTLARQRCRERVVVKRPKGGCYFENTKPNFSIPHPSLRFDVYLTAV